MRIVDEVNRNWLDGGCEVDDIKSSAVVDPLAEIFECRPIPEL